MFNANTGKLYDFEMLQTGLQYVGWKAVLDYTRILKFCIKWVILLYTSEISAQLFAITQDKSVWKDGIQWKTLLQLRYLFDCKPQLKKFFWWFHAAYNQGQLTFFL